MLPKPENVPNEYIMYQKVKNIPNGHEIYQYFPIYLEPYKIFQIGIFCFENKASGNPGCDR
jgi:hypothetical protein